MLWKAADLWKDEMLELRCSLLSQDFFWVMSLCVPLPQIKTKKQSYLKGFDSIRFDFSMLLQTCTVSVQLLEMQKDLKAFSPLSGVGFANKILPSVSWHTAEVNWKLNLVVLIWIPDLEPELDENTSSAGQLHWLLKTCERTGPCFPW